MKRKTFSKAIWILILISFLQGIEFSGIILVPFFTDWGGIDQFHIQLLQSIFTFCVFAFEIPTGLIGDARGLKFSLIVGEILSILGFIVYASIPNFYIFALGEIILAISSAFISGANEAMLYETAKDNGEEGIFNRIVSLKSNLHLVAMLLTSAFAGILVDNLELNQIFLLNAIPRILSLSLMVLFVKEPKRDEEKELVPDYKKILSNAISGLKNSPELRKISIFTTIMYGVSYFIIWFYQPLLKNLGVQNDELGIYRIILILSEISAVSVILWFVDRFKRKRTLINIILVLLAATGFFVAAVWKDITGILLFLIISGGIGLQSREIFSKTLNEKIESKQRATSLSAISMISKLFLAVSNIVFGFLSDISLNMTLGILGGILLLGGIIFLPKDS